MPIFYTDLRLTKPGYLLSEKMIPRQTQMGTLLGCVFFFFKSTFRIHSTHWMHISTTMNRQISKSQTSHNDPSEPNEMSIEFQSELHQIMGNSPPAAKRARTVSFFEENTHTMTTDTNAENIPCIEISSNSSESSIRTEPSSEDSFDLDRIVDEFRNSIHRMYNTDVQLFKRAMKQLEGNYELLDILLKSRNQGYTVPLCQFIEQSSETELYDQPYDKCKMSETSNDFLHETVTDVVDIFESNLHDDFEIAFMEKIIAEENNNKIDIGTRNIKGKNVIVEKDVPYKKIEDKQHFLDILLDDSSKFSFPKNNIDQYHIDQIMRSEYSLLFHVIQSENIRKNPSWSHTVDLYHHTSTRKNEVWMQNIVCNRDCKEALVTIDAINLSPHEFDIKGRYLVRSDLMSRLRLYHKSKKIRPWFGRDINVMKICGINENNIHVENLQIQTRVNEISKYRWLTVPTMKVCLVVFGVALERGFSPVNPRVDYCTMSHDNGRLMKMGFCLSGKERFAGMVTEFRECIIDGCKNIIKSMGKCDSHRFGECIIDGCNSSARSKEGKCDSHLFGECIIDGCNSNAVSKKGKCKSHLFGECIIDGCNSKARSKEGKCDSHRFGECIIDGCNSNAVSKKGKCKSHLFGECIIDGCSSNAVSKKGKCNAHLFGECIIDGCNSNARSKEGKCNAHRFGECIIDGCNSNARSKEGKCDSHLFGECIIDGCNSNAVSKKGKCNAHLFGECIIDGCNSNAISMHRRCGYHRFGKCTGDGCKVYVRSMNGRCAVHQDG